MLFCLYIKNIRTDIKIQKMKDRNLLRRSNFVLSNPKNAGQIAHVIAMKQKSRVEFSAREIET
jgi:hypothetical protein